MKNLQKIFILIILTVLSTSFLTSCGRYSEPSPVQGSGFPHRYPQH